MKKVTVKAKKCFYWGRFANQMKKPSSEPFEVTEWEYQQLNAKGMVDLAEGPSQEEPEAAEPSKDEGPSQEEPEAAKPQKRGRKTTAKS
ncbi:hypothetical protein EXA18_06250 [Vibrio cincinnatiensis]|uniref:hypothetical protein n=1 Tax=Vibrio cincinnatiensis TaxID=675 RepID=UPI001EE0130C|nr:hypothetical protein [Vibrio cincinnatiensis]MCG3743089.1 hypothetical protein [Vibrio cincinnatiensis]